MWVCIWSAATIAVRFCEAWAAAGNVPSAAKFRESGGFSGF
jgi:hypothetical protein